MTSARDCTLCDLGRAAASAALLPHFRARRTLPVALRPLSGAAAVRPECEGGSAGAVRVRRARPGIECKLECGRLFSGSNQGAPVQCTARTPGQRREVECGARKGALGGAQKRKPPKSALDCPDGRNENSALALDLYANRSAVPGAVRVRTRTAVAGCDGLRRGLPQKPSARKCFPFRRRTAHPSTARRRTTPAGSGSALRKGGALDPADPIDQRDNQQRLPTRICRGRTVDGSAALAVHFPTLTAVHTQSAVQLTVSVLFE